MLGATLGRPAPARRGHDATYIVQQVQSAQGWACIASRASMHITSCACMFSREIGCSRRLQKRDTLPPYTHHGQLHSAQPVQGCRSLPNVRMRVRCEHHAVRSFIARLAQPPAFALLQAAAAFVAASLRAKSPQRPTPSKTFQFRFWSKSPRIGTCRRLHSSPPTMTLSLGIRAWPAMLAYVINQCPTCTAKLDSVQPS